MRSFFARRGSEAKNRTTLKLVTERFEFVGLLEAIRGLTDNTDFIVFSVLGPQGAGKSSLMNELVHALSPQKADNIQTPQVAFGSQTAVGPFRKPFPVETVEILQECAHQTVGVDVYATSERIVLLDCQPVLSSSVVIDMVLEGAALPDGVSVSLCPGAIRFAHL